MLGHSALSASAFSDLGIENYSLSANNFATGAPVVGPSTYLERYILLPLTFSTGAPLLPQAVLSDQQYSNI
jgi:hypothetical protein